MVFQIKNQMALSAQEISEVRTDDPNVQMPPKIHAFDCIINIFHLSFSQ